MSVTQAEIDFGIQAIAALIKWLNERRALGLQQGDLTPAQHAETDAKLALIVIDPLGGRHQPPPPPPPATGAIYEVWMANEPTHPPYEVGDHKYQKIDGSGQWLATEKKFGTGFGFAGANYVGDVS